MLSVPATSDWRNNPPLRACDPTQQGPPMGICAPRTRLPTACSGTALQRTVPLPLRVSVSHALKLFDSLLDVHYQTPPPRPSPPLLRKLETSAASVCTSRPSPPHKYLSFCSNSYVDTHVAADAFAGTVRIDEDARAAQLCPERQRSAALAGTSIICNISFYLPSIHFTVLQCQYRHLPACLFVSLVEQYELSPQSLAAFEPTLSAPPLGLPKPENIAALYVRNARVHSTGPATLSTLYL